MQACAFLHSGCADSHLFRMYRLHAAGRASTYHVGWSGGGVGSSCDKAIYIHILSVMKMVKIEKTRKNRKDAVCNVLFVSVFML